MSSSHTHNFHLCFRYAVSEPFLCLVPDFYIWCRVSAWDTFLLGDDIARVRWTLWVSGWLYAQGKPFNITVIQVHALTSNAEETEVEQFYEDLQDLLELTPNKRCPFHYRGLEFKSRKSGNTWSNSQVWPWSRKWSRAKANRVLWRERSGHSKHPLATTQEKTLHMDVTIWSILKSDWEYSLEKLCTLCKSKIRRWLWLR